MEKINNEYYVSPEIAKLLAKAGFNWKVNHHYPNIKSLGDNDKGYIEECPFYEDFNNNGSNSCSCPTLDIVQRWLREVKRIFIHISIYAVTEQEISDSDKFSVYAETWDSQSKFWNKWVSIFEIDDFNIYEEAQEAGIEKVLEIILEKGK